MRAVVQRVSRARVTSAGELLGAIAAGMLVLCGALAGDGEQQAVRLAERIARFRFFEDDHQRMNLSALDLGLEVLVVSQFTLAADGRKGRRPSFDGAAAPDIARPLEARFVRALEELGLHVEQGRFGARMEVELVNDGPVTFSLEEPPSRTEHSSRP